MARMALGEVSWLGWLWGEVSWLGWLWEEVSWLGWLCMGGGLMARP